MIDPIGLAIKKYWENKDDTPIRVSMNRAENEELSPSYFFRDYNEMPFLEKKALDLCHGTVLDVGCGAGSHSLILQERGFDVCAIDISSDCIDVVKERGVLNFDCVDFKRYHGKKFDTLLFMMNGIGVAESLGGFGAFLTHCKELLNRGGHIVFDSSDLIYLYQEDDGSVLIDINDETYYGEVEYELSYNGVKGVSFQWLFIDIENLTYWANLIGFEIETLVEGKHFDYLCRLKLKD